MDKRIYFLMIISFVVGMVELIISGILDLIAADLNVTLGQAGYLITIFSLVFAIASPILLIATAKIERKRLTLIFLVIFFLGNIVTVLSPTYNMLFIGRIITAISGALLIILCLVMAPTIVEPRYRGRAIGIVSMGISGSLVLGIPIGLVLGNTFGWRAPFVLITLLTLLSIIGVFFLMDRVEPRPAVPIRTQLASLKNKRILFAHVTTFLYMAGHSALYAYFKPFIQATTQFDGAWISFIYFVFGMAAVSGGGIGGAFSDRYGAKRMVFLFIILFSGTIFAIPYMTGITALFFIGIITWGVLSWAISPAMQSYLIQTAPETSDIQQSLNNSSLHLGIAFGSFVGAIVIEQASVLQNATVGGVLVFLSLITTIISMTSKSKVKKNDEIGYSRL